MRANKSRKKRDAVQSCSFATIFFTTVFFLRKIPNWKKQRTRSDVEFTLKFKAIIYQPQTQLDFETKRTVHDGRIRLNIKSIMWLCNKLYLAIFGFNKQYVSLPKDPLSEAKGSMRKVQWRFCLQLVLLCWRELLVMWQSVMFEGRGGWRTGALTYRKNLSSRNTSVPGSQWSQQEPSKNIFSTVNCQKCRLILSKNQRLRRQTLFSA